MEPSQSKMDSDLTAGLFSSLGSVLGNKLKKPLFTMENFIVLAVIYFMLSDSDELDTDLLIIIGVLFFLEL